MRKTCCVLIVCFITMCSTAQEPTHSSHGWAYEGPEGPLHWGDIKSEYETCKLGRRQSPIDIHSARLAALPRIQFSYKASPLTVVNNGHAIQFNSEPGNFILIGEKRYDLKQFHFHHPSEEKIEGQAFTMVAHLVHSDAQGHLAVVAVLFRTGNANSEIGKLWQYLPAEEGREREIPGRTVNVALLLPEATGYYTYDGSLTTPPCSETVTWFVLRMPGEISAEQAAAYATLYPHNARPVQPLNGRTISQSK